MMRVTFYLALLVFFVPNAGADPVPATQPAVDPTADQILRQSCDFLAQSPAFAVHAEIWKDVILPSGHKIQVTRSVDLDLRRPDRFRRAVLRGSLQSGRHVPVLLCLVHRSPDRPS